MVQSLQCHLRKILSIHRETNDMKETTMNLRVDPVVKQDTEARGLFLPAVNLTQKFYLPILKKY